MNNPSLDVASIISSSTFLVRKNPELAALFIFLILVLDTLYVYRMFKKVWRKPRRKSDNTHPCKKNRERSE